jgi:two-component system, cell cycle sensor histidine kinase and response regulator CckA
MDPPNPRPDVDAGKGARGHRFRAIVENAPEILALLGPSGIIQYVSPQTEKLLGHRPADVEGRNIFEFIHPEDAPRAAQEYSDTIQHAGERAPSVLRLRDRNGDWLPFEIVASNCLENPAIGAVIFAARDLRFRKEIVAAIHRSNADIEAEAAKRTTELARINAELRIENQARRQAEDRLQQTVSVLNATLDSTADGLLVVSNDGKVTSCNRKFIEMWRLSCGASVGRADDSIIAEVLDQLQSPNEFVQRVRELYSDPAATSYDVLHFKDGRIFERYSQPQRVNGNIIGRVWSFRDVTRARNLELDLRQSQKMEAVGRLAGGIAHDFNNVLMLISGYASQLKENPSPEERDAIGGQILAATRRAASVTKQLLAFSRKQPEAPAVADLNLVVLNLERMLERLLSDQIQLQVSVAPDPQPIFADVSQMEMMIMNLAVNAQDAMPEGGRLSIATSTHDIPVAQDGGETTRTFAVLEVSDTGYGMTPDVQARIFEPFFTTKQLGRGTGLGLSTVLGIAERAGGRVEVQSELNRGTTFRVYLPQVQGATATAFVPSALLPPGGGTETILLAEDESGIRAMTRAYLESLGYSVLEAADGSEAVARAIEYGGPIHLVLTDLLMPGLRGDAVVKAIRAYRPGIKALFMSGYAEPGLSETADNILYKPFEFPELGRRLRQALDARPTDTKRPLDPAAD